ncbi:hypothetical protein CMO89_04275 [Candidatus Woesearchaeota archaeon]|nr:hypothetical protein [Candidatus Woesearchaeota archaeon]|tara:strand:- start:24635 stop:26251 length:1617 start_codon:yes stop_codon:yes gene_type:complete
MNKDVYLREVLEQMPRLLGLLDTNPLTKTYGCFDREYWHYNTTDTPSARKQEAVLTLALLYKIKHKDNAYYNNKKILEWINAGIDFWERIQAKDGSFSEWYPNEHSFVATSFSSYAVSETLLILGSKIRNRHSVISSLRKAGNWLKGRYEPKVQNQQSGSALSQLNIYLLTKNKCYLKDAEKKVNNLIRNQTKEGWWFEYGGPDIGYLSLTIDYLAKYYAKRPSMDLRRAIEKAVSFISYFIHPDLSAGGCYASRNTEYLIPSGFEIVGRKSSKGSKAGYAGAVSSFVREAINKKEAVSPFSLDDRYLSYIAYNWLQAFLSAGKPSQKKQRQRFEENFSKDFKLSKIYILSNPCFYFIMNYDKGTFRVFFKKTGKGYTDSGVLVRSGSQSYILGLSGSAARFFYRDNKLELKGSMRKLSKNVLAPGKNICLRLFQATIGRSGIASSFIKNRLRDMLVMKSRKTDIGFSREIYFLEDSIKVVDRLSNVRMPGKIVAGDKFSYLFVPSANYFQASDINNFPSEASVTKRRDAVEIIRKIK